MLFLFLLLYVHMQISRIVSGSKHLLQDLYLRLLTPHTSHKHSSTHQPSSKATLPAHTPETHPSSSSATVTEQTDKSTAQQPNVPASTAEQPELLPGQIAGVHQIQEHTWRQTGDQQTAVELVARLPAALLSKVRGLMKIA